MSTQFPIPVAVELPPDTRIALVATRWNAGIVEELLRGCLQRLAERGIADINLKVHRVPGAFELPVIAQRLARTGRYGAIICLGCIVRGDTPHFDYIAAETTRGLQAAALATETPTIFGVLTVNTQQQALDRAGGSHSHVGVSSADAALEMIEVVNAIAGEGLISGGESAGG